MTIERNDKRSGRKRANGEGTIRQRSNGLWEAQILLPDGKRKSVYGKGQKDVLEKLRDLRRAAEQGLAVGQKSQTVGGFLRDWLTNVVSAGNAPKTHQSYREQVEKHIAPALGRHRLDKLTAQHVQSFLNAQRQAGLSARTVAYQRAILRRALNQAIEWRLISYNAAAVAKPPRQERKQVRALTLEEAKDILAAFEGAEMGMLVRAGLMLGLRRGELLGLRWADLDLDAGVLHVRYQVQRWGGEWRFVPPKSRESRRSLTIPRFVIGELRTHRTRQLERRLTAGPLWQDYDLVFPSAVGSPQDGTNVLHRFQARLRRAGLPAMPFHHLRHGTATMLLAKGVDLKTISDILGHSRIATTADLYAHVAPQLKQAAADTLDAAFAT